MTLQLLGINHKTAPIELRERLAIAPGALPEATRQLLAIAGVSEGLILSTCNRVELLTSSEPTASSGAVEFLRHHFAVDMEILRPHLYRLEGREAVHHLFRVASSLDSMVVGEPQILGQVKAAYTVARSVGAVQSTLERLLQSAFAAAKRVRTETEIGTAAISIASVAVDLARKVFGTLEGKTVLLVGAGKMSELAARHLLAGGAGSLLIANRTFERAVEVARAYDGRAIRFEDLYASAADIIITSTGAAHPILCREHVQQFLHKRRNRPIFLIDIAVPRDVDPRVNRLDNVFLYDIDDLSSVAAQHLSERREEAEQAERIVAVEVERYHRDRQALDLVPAIVALQQNLEEVRQAELRRAAPKLQSLTPEQRAAVEALTRGLVNKVLHQPLRAMKSAAREGDLSVVEAVRQIFALPEAPAPAEALSSAPTAAQPVLEPVLISAEDRGR